mgnify:CR=1 FL=1
MRTAFYISDGTGITSEVFGHALLSLFEAEFDHVTIPFVETSDKALHTKQRINDRYKTTGVRPLVFLTFVDEGLRAIINSSDGVCYDFLNAFVEPMQKELGIQAMPKTHRTHSIHEKTYDFRIDAVNYALANDDGSNLKDYAKADIIKVEFKNEKDNFNKLFREYFIKNMSSKLNDFADQELKILDSKKINENNIIVSTKIFSKKCRMV